MPRVQSPGEVDQLSQLQAANDELMAENARLNQVLDSQKSTVKVALGMAVVVFVGPKLSESIYHLMLALQRGATLPLSEVADVLAAIVRRCIRVGVVGLAVASLPIGLLFWQNLEIRRQNSAIQEQMDRQYSDSLQQSLFDTGRNKQRALDEWIALHPNNRALPGIDLSNCILPRGYDLSGFDIRKAMAIDATLSGLKMRNVDLQGAELLRADFRSTDLSNADLRNARMVMTMLRKSNLRGADLRRAILNGAKLDGADLSGAKLEGATYQISTTEWPAGFDPVAAGAVPSDAPGYPDE